MPTPSLLIVPARFKSGKLYSQIPTSGAGDFTVTRATAATRVNASGLIESVASGIPRLDYFASGGTVGCPALLVEPAATNLVPSGTVYTALPGSLVSSVTDTPAIGVSGALCTKNEASGTLRYISQSFSAVALSSGTTYSVSRFFKYNGVAFNTTLEANTGGQWGNVSWKQVIVLSAASGVTIGASTACTGSVENFGNGWYRVNARVTTGGTISGSANVTVISELPSALSTGQGFLTACPQLETGSVATSYIPTTTGSVTRNADVVSVSGAVSGSIGQASGTIYIECQSEFATNDIIVINTAGQSPGNNFVSITKTPTNVFRLTIFTSGTIILIDQTSAITSFAKIAVAYASGNTAFFINGTQIGSTNTTGFSFNAALNNIIFISNMVTGTKSTRIRAAALYTTRLSNAELAALTTP